MTASAGREDAGAGPPAAGAPRPARGGPGRSVRALAIEVLFEVHHKPGLFAHDRMYADAAAARLDRRDRRFLNELVFGVLRHELTIDRVLAAHSRIPLSDVGPRALEALRVGVYQLLWLDGVPPFAAIHATVGTVRDARVRPFVNGVLRGVDRRVRRLPLEHDRGGASPRRRLEIRGRKVCFFPEDVFADPGEDLAQHLGEVHSHPPALVRRWIERFGAEKATAILERNHEPPPLFVRVQRLKTGRAELIARLRGEGIDCGEGSRPDSIRVVSSPAELVASRAFAAGLCTVQDETAMLVAPLLDPKPGQLVLDLCAAPGGKATHLAELSNDQATILAVDRDETRLAKLRESIARLGLASISCMVADATTPEAVRTVAPAPFDRVLVDAPCSNTGVLARRPEAKLRFDAARLAELVALQRRLLATAVDRLFPGGLLAYSTCSLEREENGGQTQALLAAHRDLELVEERETLPAEGGGDGGYVALLRRKGAAPAPRWPPAAAARGDLGDDPRCA